MCVKAPLKLAFAVLNVAAHDVSGVLWLSFSCPACGQDLRSTGTRALGVQA